MSAGNKEAQSTEQVTQSEVQKDAARYRWIRTKANSLEGQQSALGKSCYHVVGGIRELKSETELDEAVDSAIEQHEKDVVALAQLQRFYVVGSLAQLALAQAKHIERLQAKIPPMRDTHPGYVPREG